MAQFEIEQYYPQPGWVEQDPEEIWTAQLATARRALTQAGIGAKDVASIGITNQRETVVLWDRTTGVPIHNAIVWQDRRTADRTNALKEQGLETMVQERTGLVLDPYFSATKLQWLLDRIDGARDRAKSGDLAFGTIDTWLLKKLTGGRVHATDVTNAARTMMLNIHSLKWDQELLALFDIPESILPEIRPSSGIIADTDADLLGRAIPISGMAGDQNAGLFGQLCIKPGMAKNTYGTGCATLVNTGGQYMDSRHGLVTTLAWKQTEQAPQYALEGNIFIGGAAIQWLRDGLGIIGSALEADALASQVTDSGGAYFVPAFVGLGAPHWNPYARGALLGLTRGTTRAHICRATLEAIAYQVTDVVVAMQRDTNQAIEELRVDGGVAASDLLLQIQADDLGIPVQRPELCETTALGVAYLAGLAINIWSGIEDIEEQRRVDRVFEPGISADEREARRCGWHKALDRARDWASS
jgi:glycerol kinase